MESDAECPRSRPNLAFPPSLTSFASLGPIPQPSTIVKPNREQQKANALTGAAPLNGHRSLSVQAYSYYDQYKFQQVIDKIDELINALRG